MQTLSENSKYFNSFLDKIIKFTGKTVEAIKNGQRQVSMFKSVEAKRDALEYSFKKFSRLLDSLERLKEK